MTPVESDETKRKGKLRVLMLELAHSAKRLDAVDGMCEYTTVSIIDKEETVHRFPVPSRLHC